MVNIPMRTSGSFSAHNINSINSIKVQTLRSSNNILELNNGISHNTIQNTQAQQTTNMPQQINQTFNDTEPTVYAISHIDIPPLHNKVQKGQKVALFSNTTSPYIDILLGWNVKNSKCDVDVSAFLLGDNGKVLGDSWFVFYGQTKSPDNSVNFSVCNNIDREKIHIDLTKLNTNVKKIVFVLTINDALINNLNFGMLQDAYIRILDNTGKELVSFLMSDYYSNVISMMIGEIYMHNGIWKFSAIGNGVARDLEGLCNLYGVEVN